MRKPSPAMLVALLALFVALGGVGVAATGSNFILGQSNTANKTTGLSVSTLPGSTTCPAPCQALQVTDNSTAGNAGGLGVLGKSASTPAATIKNTGGASALNLVVNAGKPPLTVNSSAKVAGLNADLLDGIDSTGFVRTKPPVSLSGSSSSPILSATNSGSGIGLRGASSEYDGLWGISHASGDSGVSGHNDAGGYGVYGITSGTGIGTFGYSPNGRGVAGFSGSWQGVYGHSDGNVGVVGESSNFDGVWGQGHTSANAGVSGHNDAGGYGVWAAGGNAANGTDAIFGTSSASNGVHGESSTSVASGVYGHNSAGGAGVAGRSETGPALLGDTTSGWAVRAQGNATQSRDKGGFVKAMAYVDPNDSATDPIKQCYNSQLPAGQAASGNCGISYSSDHTGSYTIDFGFEVDDRIVTVTSGAVNAAGQCYCSGGVTALAVRNNFSGNSIGANQWHVFMTEPGTGLVTNTFFIVVY